ncbi:MAG TPA: hypothetical protein VGQ93_17085, partial [Lysobacter sp.]|nr:hypothetical protein [Lysobacter sp.]
TVWLRRWYQPLASQNLHPADVKFAQNESNEFVRGVINLLGERERFWINPIAAKSRADRKPVQLLVAREVGLNTPDTLFSNDPEQIRRFFHEHDGRVIYKPLTSAAWLDGDRSYATFTSALSEELLQNPASLSNSPGIFQPLLEKDYELRVTVIGRNVFAARIDSQREGNYLTDWRANQLDHRMRCEVYKLPLEIEDRCRALLDRLGLVFGAIDFVVTPKGDYVFLEINEMGQFLWLEGPNPEFPLLDCFVKFMLSKDRNYRYNPRGTVHSFAAYCDSMEERGDRDPEAGRHVPLPRWFEMQE